MNQSKYNLRFNEKHYGINDVISYPVKPMRKLYKWLGFRYKNECIIIEEPVLKEGHYVYTLKILRQGLYWFRFKIKDL